jgi:hypothetical protein
LQQILSTKKNKGSCSRPIIIYREIKPGKKPQKELNATL